MLTCYRNNSLERYRGIALLVNGGYGAGKIRIADGDKQLISGHVFHVLERTVHFYSLGRSGTELVIECLAESPENIYRIDIEDKF